MSRYKIALLAALQAKPTSMSSNSLFPERICTPLIYKNVKGDVM